MNVIFYSTTDDPRKLQKSLIEITAKECQVYESCTITNPALILRYDTALINANIFYIPDWNRYYRVSEINFESGEIMVISGDIDYLQTYASDILNLKCTCIRNGGLGKPTYVVDTSLPIKQGESLITAQLFPKIPTNTNNVNCFVLTTLGG